MAQNETGNDNRRGSSADQTAPRAVRPEFATSLRERFTSTDFGASQDEALLRVINTMEVPAPRPEFRDELQRRFIAVPATRRPAGRRRRRPERPVARPRGRRPLAIAGSLAAAAAVLLVFWITRGGETPVPAPTVPPAPTIAWTPVSGFDGTAASLDGQSLAGLDAEMLTTRLQSGSVIVTDETSARLRMTFGDLLIIELDPGSTLDFSGARDDSGELFLHGTTGAFRIATGPGFDHERHRLTFRSPDFDATVVGTVFGIDVLDAGTCLCCTEGAVDVTPLNADDPRGDVGKEKTRFFPQGAPSIVADLYEPHAGPLVELAAFWQE